MREDSMINALKVRLLVLALGLFFAGATQGATILVTSRTDVIAVDGVVTLREALNSINTGADVNADVTANRSGAAYGTSDTLTFNFVGGGGVIPLANALGALTITKTVNIMGFTQPTAVANSAATGDNSNHQIVVSGFLLNAGVDCMDITGQPSSGTQLRGFVFDQCPAAGLAITNSKNNVIAGDFFGTDSAGNFSAGAGNATGLSIAANAGTDDISGNQIGGPNPADRNVISGNTVREMLIGNFGGPTAVTTGIFVQNSYNRDECGRHHRGDRQPTGDIPERHHRRDYRRRQRLSRRVVLRGVQSDRRQCERRRHHDARNDEQRQRDSGQLFRHRRNRNLSSSKRSARPHRCQLVSYSDDWGHSGRYR
jgi:hypothetical protein